MSASTSPAMVDSSANAAAPQLPYPLRLPSYRSSYCGRYHPYGRKPSDRKVDLMKTIDMRFTEVQSRGSLSLSIVEEEEEFDENISDGTTDSEPVSETTTTAITGPPSSKALIARRLSFTNLIVAFAFAIRRNLEFRKG